MQSIYIYKGFNVILYESYNCMLYPRTHIWQRTICHNFDLSKYQDHWLRYFSYDYACLFPSVILLRGLDVLAVISLILQNNYLKGKHPNLRSFGNLKFLTSMCSQVSREQNHTTFCVCHTRCNNVGRVNSLYQLYNTSIKQKNDRDMFHCVDMFHCAVFDLHTRQPVCKESGDLIQNARPLVCNESGALISNAYLCNLHCVTLQKNKLINGCFESHLGAYARRHVRLVVEWTIIVSF